MTPERGCPVIDADRCMVVTDAAYSFGTVETRMWVRGYDGEFRSVLGERRLYQFYPDGSGECT